MRYWAVIPAAGVGSRMKADRPKQYLSLAGRTVLEQTLNIFFAHPAIHGIVVAISADDPYFAQLRLHDNKPLRVVEGGRERCHSVANALACLQQEADPQDWVLVHDAARPCLTQAELTQLIDQLQDDPVGGILATPVRDTKKRAAADGRIAATVDRTDLWRALTPQMFRLGMLADALQQALAAEATLTDEASALEFIGQAPRLIEGSVRNIKITQPEDLALAEFYLRELTPRF